MEMDAFCVTAALYLYGLRRFEHKYYLFYVFFATVTFPPPEYGECYSRRMTFQMFPMSAGTKYALIARILE